MRVFAPVVLVLALGLTACSGAGNATPIGEAPPIVVDEFAIIAEGRVLPRQFVQLSFSTGGKVAQVLHAEGDQVAEGAVLARLENSEALAAEVARAELERLNAQQAVTDLNESAAMTRAQAEQAVALAQDALEKAQRRLKNTVSPDVAFYQDRVDDARRALTVAQQNAEIIDIGGLNAALTAAQDALEDAENTLTTFTDLEARYPGGYTDALKEAQKAHDLAVNNVKTIELQIDQARSGNTAALRDAQEALDDALANLADAQAGPEATKLALAQADVTLAQATLDDAHAHLAKVATGPDPEQLALAETRVATAEAALIAAQAALDKNELRAPFAGTLATLSLKVGEQVGPGQAVMTLADFSGWMVETDNLTEIEVVKITSGQGVDIVLDALPDTTLRGQVVSIRDVFEEKRGDVTYTVKITMTDAHPQMRWGMTAQVTFDK
jgi:HlyD family secretion protein